MAIIKTRNSRCYFGSTYVPSRGNWRSGSGRVGGPSWNWWGYARSDRNWGRDCGTVGYWGRGKLPLREGRRSGLWSTRIEMRRRWWWRRAWWYWWTVSSILNFFVDGSTLLQLTIYGWRILLSAFGDSIMLRGMDDGLWNAYNSSLEISAQKFKLPYFSIDNARVIYTKKV